MFSTQFPTYPMLACSHACLLLFTSIQYTVRHSNNKVPSEVTGIDILVSSFLHSFCHMHKVREEPGSEARQSDYMSSEMFYRPRHACCHLLDYCTSKTVNFSLNNTDIQCAHDRSDLLCGACKEVCSLVLGTSQCKQYTNNYISYLAHSFLSDRSSTGLLAPCLQTHSGNRNTQWPCVLCQLRIPRLPELYGKALSQGIDSRVTVTLLTMITQLY